MSVSEESLMQWVHDVNAHAEGSTAFLSHLTDTVTAFLDAAADDDDLHERAATVLVAGASLLTAYNAASMTGPLSPAVGLSVQVLDALQGRAVLSLRLNGEDVYEQAPCLPLLALARCFLVEPRERLGGVVPSIHVWAGRCCVAHQHVLSHNVPQLKEESEAAYTAAVAVFGVDDVLELQVDEDEDPEDRFMAGFEAGPLESIPTYTMRAGVEVEPHRRALAVHVYLEDAYRGGMYWAYARLSDGIGRAKAVIGLDLELTGVMGKRTIWQQDKKAQLVLRARPSTAVLLPGLDEQEPSGWIDDVEACDLNSDVLLDRLALDADENDGGVQKRLFVLDQLVVLAISYELGLRSPESSSVVCEERLAMLSRLLEDAQDSVHSSWAVQMQGMMERSFLEKSDHHKMERALLQLEAGGRAPKVFPEKRRDGKALVTDTHGMDSAEARTQQAVVRRLAQAPAAGLAPAWATQRRFAEMLRSMGYQSAALTIYKELQLLDDYFEMLVACGRRTEAEAFIREKMEESGEKPLYLCLLGDILEEAEYYERAWELSDHSYSRAQRALGTMKRLAEQWEEAAQHYRLALDINPMRRDECFALGHCLMKLERYEEAASAFSRTVVIDPEYGDAWNNVAAAHLHMGHYAEAFTALTEATRVMRKSWKVWDNYVHAALKCGKLQRAMFALEHIVEIHDPKEALDGGLLVMLTNFVLERYTQAHESGDETDMGAADYLANRQCKMLGHLSSKVTTMPEIWQSLSRVYHATHDLRKAVSYAEKECRAWEVHSWQRDPSRVESVLRATNRLLDLYLEQGTPDALYSGKVKVENLLAKLQLVHDDEQAKAAAGADGEGADDEQAADSGNGRLALYAGFVEQVADMLQRVQGGQEEGGGQDEQDDEQQQQQASAVKQHLSSLFSDWRS